MRNIQSILDGEPAIAVFTNRDKKDDSWRNSLELNKEHRTGSTGDWVIDNDKVAKDLFIIIYLRQGGRNKIYKAIITETKYIGDKRYRIYFEDYELLGETYANWHEFADSGTNPVRYINI